MKQVVVNKNATDEEIQNVALKAVESYVSNGYKKIVYVKNRIFNIIV